MLYISDIITDISSLSELSEGRPHLQFLLNPEKFDYAQVDFSNYMWANFARCEKYMKYFIAHKDTIIPKIKEQIEKNNATEEEKKFYMDFCLSGTKCGKYKAAISEEVFTISW